MPSVDQLLESCFDRPEADWEAAIAALCRANAADAAEIRRRFDKLRAIGFTAPPRIDAPPPGSEAPRRFGGFRILDLLGSGGMGIVYLAEQESTGRKVALKIIRSEQLFFPRARQRFRREVEVAARLDHPGICAVHEAGEVDGTPYIAMHYVAGETLARRIAKAKDDSARTSLDAAARREEILRSVQLIERVARALHVAHEAGLVHRDVKPGNVMVSAADEPVLLDFGLAHDDSDEHSLTATGSLLGTPAYMAPEQIARHGTPADRRADVYALGATLYECLCRRPPFEAQSREALYHAILHEDPTPPLAIEPAIPKDLAIVLATALEKDRDRRYATALDLAEDLRRVRDREPIRARRAGPLRRLQRWTQRNRLGASFVALLLLGLALTLWLLDRNAASLNRAHARELVGASRAAMPSNGVLALLLAHDAVRRLPDDHETVSQLHAALVASHERVLFGPHPESVRHASIHVGRGLVATATVASAVHLWDLDGNELDRRQLAGAAHLAQLSHDGTKLLVGTSGGALLLDVTSRRLDALLGELPTGEDTFVRFGAFSPDDRHAVTAAWKANIELWDLASPKSPRSTVLLAGAGHGWNPGGRPSFSADGSLVTAVTGSIRGSRGQASSAPLVWSLDGSRLEPEPHAASSGELALPVEPPLSTCFLPKDAGGVIRLVATDTLHAHVWAVRGNRLVHERALPGHAGDVVHVDGSPNGDAIATASQDGRAAIWPIASDSPPLFLPANRARVSLVRFSPDGRWLLAASIDGGLRVWDRTGHLIAELAGHSHGIEHAEWVADLPGGAAGILTASFDGTARLWHLFDPELPALLGHEHRVVGGGFVPPERWGGASLLTLSLDRSLRRWDVRGRQVDDPSQAPRIGQGRIWLGALSTSGNALAVAASGAVYLVCCAESGAIDWGKRLGHHANALGCLSLSADADRLVTSPRRFDGDACWIYELGSASAPRRRRLERRTEQGLEPWPEVEAVAISPKRRDELLVVNARHLHVVSLAAAEPAILFDRQTLRDYEAAAWSTDGEQIAVGGRDGVVEIWDQALSRPQPLLLQGHDGAVVAIAFSADGQLVLTGSQDRTAKLWTRTGRELATYRAHMGTVTTVAFSADGRSALTTSDDGTARLWHVSRQDLVEHVERRLRGRAYTADQRRRYAELLPGKAR